jgi:protease I
MPVPRVAMLTADGVERRDVEVLRRSLEDADLRVDLVALQKGEVWAVDQLDKVGTFPVDVTLRDARAYRYDCLVIPGGVVAADHLRRDPAAIALVFDFATAGKPVAAAGHAPWLLIEADLVRGKTLTSWPSLRTDVVNAGGEWVDRDPSVDGPLLTCGGGKQLEALSEELLRRVPAR